MNSALFLNPMKFIMNMDHTNIIEIKGIDMNIAPGGGKGRAYETLDIYNPEDKLIYCGEFNKVGDY